MGDPVLVSATVTDELVSLSISDADFDDVASKLKELMTRQGYRIESGDEYDGVFGTGNDIARILLGALAKRYKFDVKVTDANGRTNVRVTKAMSGWSGGLIGKAKLKTEFRRIGKLLETGIAKRKPLK